MQRKKKVEEYEAIIHNLMLETTDKYSVIQLEQNAKWQVCTNMKMHLESLSFELSFCAMSSILSKVWS